MYYNIPANHAIGIKPIATQTNIEYDTLSPAGSLLRGWHCAIGFSAGLFVWDGDIMKNLRRCRFCRVSLGETNFSICEKCRLERKTICPCGCGQEMFIYDRYGNKLKALNLSHAMKIAHSKKEKKETKSKGRMGAARKTKDDYLALAVSKNWEWLGDSVPRTDEKSLWRCDKGHLRYLTYASIYMGQGCKECYLESRRLKPEAFHILAESKGWEWLGPEVKGTDKITRWRCPKGHEFESSYNRLFSGSGCPTCYDRYKKTPEDYHALAASKNGWKWLGPEVKNIRTKTWWECPNGHKIERRYDDLRTYGCEKCYRDRQVTPPARYREIAESKGLEWIGPEVRHTTYRTFWLCPKGHNFKASLDNIKAGQHCSRCSSSRGEKRIAILLDDLGISYETQKSFEKCRRDSRLLYYDFYFAIGKFRFLVEYDGLHHDQPIKYFGGEETFKRMQESDRIKAEFASQYGFALIRISYKVKNIEQVLRWKIEEFLGYSLDIITPVPLPERKIGYIQNYRQLGLAL